MLKDFHFYRTFLRHLEIFPAGILLLRPIDPCYYSWPKNGVKPTCLLEYRNSEIKTNLSLDS